MKSSVRSFDMLKWIGVAILVVAIVGGNAYYSSVSLSLRVTVMIIVGLLTILLALTTTKGKNAFQFVKDARGELRKVVWPTRQETFQTTIMIAGIVILVALVLWGFDTLFAYLVSTVLI